MDDNHRSVVSRVLEHFPEEDVQNPKVYRHARRAEAVSLALAGLTYAQVGKELGVSPQAARELVMRTIEETRNYAVDELRLLENARLDRATAAIWPKVVEGDLAAIKTYMQISERRSKMNGLDAPAKVQMAVSVRQEMEHALIQLEEVLAAEDGQETVDVVAAEERKAIGQYIEQTDE